MRREKVKQLTVVDGPDARILAGTAHARSVTVCDRGQIERTAGRAHQAKYAFQGVIEKDTAHAWWRRPASSTVRDGAAA